MSRDHRQETGSSTRTDGAGRSSVLLSATICSLALSTFVVATAWGVPVRLGALAFWPWLLTGLQVLALWSAGTRRWWGWLLGAAVQPPWIAYAIVTTQFGFIPGCVVSVAVQTHSFLMARRPPAPRRPELAMSNSYA